MLSPAIPLRSFVGLPCLLHPRTPFDWLDPPPTQRRSPLTLAVLRIVRSGCPSTSRGSTPRVLIGRSVVFAARRCIDPCRARRGSCAVRSFGRRSATALRVTWPGRSSFGGEAFLGFRPVMTWARHCDQSFTRVTVLLSTPFPTALVGFQMCALRRFAPAMRMRRVFPPTRTHMPFASSSVAVFLLRDRPARRYQMGAFCRSLISAPSKLGG